MIAEALQQLQVEEPRAALVVQLQLEGHSFAEIAAGLGVTPQAARRLWEFGAAWMRERIGEETRGA